MPDVLIVGGGPAGLSLAAICQQRGISYVVYERSAEDTPPRGGALDLHPSSGQLAMKEAGVFDTFKKHARGGDYQIHRVYDIHGEFATSWGEGRDSPEIDRHDIQQTLLSRVPAEKVFWRKKVESVERNGKGTIVITFEDGEILDCSGCKLVVGADGSFSKVRSLITPVDPHAWGAVHFTSRMLQTNPFFARLRKKAADGPLAVAGHQTMIWCQLQGSGHYDVSFCIRCSPEFAEQNDDSDPSEMKELLLSDEYFGHHTQFYKDMLLAIDQPFRPWVLLEMPPEALEWRTSPDVTLIGDAAHTTTPFLGEGANMSMLDAVNLADKIREHGLGLEAVAAYEKDMFAHSRQIIEGSNKSGNLFYAPDAPAGFARELKENPFIGVHD